MPRPYRVAAALSRRTAYPIATFTWLLLYKKYDNAPIGEAVKKFVNFGLTDGQKFAEELGTTRLGDQK